MWVFVLMVNIHQISEYLAVAIAEDPAAEVPVEGRRREHPDPCPLVLEEFALISIEWAWDLGVS